MKLKPLILSVFFITGCDQNVETKAPQTLSDEKEEKVEFKSENLAKPFFESSGGRHDLGPACPAGTVSAGGVTANYFGSLHFWYTTDHADCVRWAEWHLQDSREDEEKRCPGTVYWGEERWTPSAKMCKRYENFNPVRFSADVMQYGTCCVDEQTGGDLDPPTPITTAKEDTGLCSLRWGPEWEQIRAGSIMGEGADRECSEAKNKAKNDYYKKVDDYADTCRKQKGRFLSWENGAPPFCTSYKNDQSKKYYQQWGQYMCCKKKEVTSGTDGDGPQDEDQVAD